MRARVVVTACARGKRASGAREGGGPDPRPAARCNRERPGPLAACQAGCDARSAPQPMRAHHPTHLRLGDAVLLAVHERRDAERVVLLAVALPEELLLEERDPLAVHGPRRRQVAQVGALERHLRQARGGAPRARVRCRSSRAQVSCHPPPPLAPAWASLDSSWSTPLAVPPCRTGLLRCPASPSTRQALVVGRRQTLSARVRTRSAHLLLTCSARLFWSSSTTGRPCPADASSTERCGEVRRLLEPEPPLPLGRPLSCSLVWNMLWMAKCCFMSVARTMSITCLRSCSRTLADTCAGREGGGSQTSGDGGRARSERRERHVVLGGEGGRRREQENGGGARREGWRAREVRWVAAQGRSSRRLPSRARQPTERRRAGVTPCAQEGNEVNAAASRSVARRRSMRRNRRESCSERRRRTFGMKLNSGVLSSWKAAAKWWFSMGERSLYSTCGTAVRAHARAGQTPPLPSCLCGRQRGDSTVVLARSGDGARAGCAGATQARPPARPPLAHPHWRCRGARDRLSCSVCPRSPPGAVPAVPAPRTAGKPGSVAPPKASRGALTARGSLMRMRKSLLTPLCS